MATILWLAPGANDRKWGALMLQAAGHRVWTVADARQGLAVLARHRPELMLLHAHPPGMEVVEAVRRMRADPTGAAWTIVALTSRTTPDFDRRLREAGCSACIASPSSLRDLCRIVDAALRMRD